MSRLSLSHLGRMLTPPTLLVAALSVVAGSSLLGVSSGSLLVPLCVAGALVALGAHLAAVVFRLLMTEWLAVGIAAAVVVGGPVVGGLPTPNSYAAFFRGMISGWADLLSSVPPVALENEVRALPYLIAWMGAMAGFGLLRQVKLPGVAALGPIAAFGLGLLFSTEARSTALVQGGLLVVLSLALGWFQQREYGFEQDEEIGNTTIARKRTRLLGAVGVLCLIAGVAPFLAPLVPGADTRDRFDLRDRLEPPWNPLDEPSPLAQLKGNYVETRRDEVVFVASGPRIPSRWGLATLAAYDGSVWTVGDSDVDGLAPFVPIDGNTPDDPAEPTAEGLPSDVEVAVEIRSLEGPWLPVPGRARTFSPTATDSLAEIRFNPRTGTAAMPDGVVGASYVVTARPGATPPSNEEIVVAPPGLIGLDQQAAAVQNRSADVVEGVASGWPQVEAIQAVLRDDGFYKADDEAQPGHSWSRLSRFLGEEQLVGNEEQYAAVAAIFARNSGLPARVVVGFVVPVDRLGEEQVAVTRGDAAAWIEVLTVEYGWVAVDVTPDRDKEPTLEDPGTRTRDVAAPNPPPPPPPPTELEIQSEEDDEDEEDEEDEESQAEDTELPLGLLAAAGAVGGPPLVFALWTSSILGLKARRRRQRQRGSGEHRIAGAWFEHKDRLYEAGIRVPNNLSVLDQATAIERHHESSEGLSSLAHAVDRAAFAANPPSDTQAETAWQDQRSLADRLKNSAGLIERLKRWANPKPLFQRDVAR